MYRKVYIETKKEQSHTVKLMNNLLICDCKESEFEGLPCRHELCVYLKGSRLQKQP